jgi:glycosyltransferase involved in cell wall biosynthesis
MIRVGFVHEDHEGWLGGQHYFRNLLSAIEELPGREIEAVVFTGRGVAEQRLAGSPGTAVVRSALLSPGTPQSLGRRLVRRLGSRDLVLERLLERHDIAVLSHSGHLGAGARIPAIGWIPDFQFLRLPEFFQPEDRERRIARSRDYCSSCACILLSSHQAQQDLRQFFPAGADRSRVLQFVADVRFDERQPGAGELQRRYGFTGEYLLVTNQFWAHKNHAVIVEALRVLRERGRRALVLATGLTHDHRQPGYFESLVEQARRCGVEDRLRILGVVPRQDLLGLMRDAAALINPSLFEGWSTVAEEARSLGKRIILSDIPVHREQDPPGAMYFPPQDPQALAAAISEMLGSADPVQSARLMDEARALLPGRRRDFARNYQGIAAEVARAGRAR